MLAAICASHTPLMDYTDPGEGARAEVNQAFDALRNFVREFAPELVVVFGPDHFNGFFYRVLPSFCVGAEATSVGDWKTPAGALPIARDISERCVSSLHQAGVDAAISYRMELDHGFTQILNLLFDWATLPPLVPVFINCAAAPRPPLARVLALGRAVGDFACTLDRRVLILGSGGLSHDPPMPTLAATNPAVIERIVAGGSLTDAARAERVTRVIEESTKQVQGLSQQVPLNAAWDRQFLTALVARDYTSLGLHDDQEVSRLAGCGGHEVRTWVAATAAMEADPAARARVLMYRPIREWIAGFAAMTIR